ncbi:MAG: AsmA-like C-terminal region-containing protein [Bacteroidota bacterium]
MKIFLITTLLLPILIFLISLAVVYYNQDKIVAKILEKANEKIAGKINIQDQHISPFENFPYISIDLKNIKLFEKKQDEKNPILHLEHVYVGFDLWTVLGGKMEIKSIELKDGTIDLVQDTLGILNVKKVFKSDESKEEKDNLKINLKKIKIINVDINKLNQMNNIKIDLFINNLNASFKASPEHLAIGCESKFLMNILKNGDTTFFKHKHIDLKAKLDFDKIKKILNIEPSDVRMENSDFNMAGRINIHNDMDLALKFGGRKSNFDLLIAFAPEEAYEFFNRFENKGNVYFTANVNGKSINGFQPQVKVFFGCRAAEFLNKKSKIKLDNLNFKAFFTNGFKRNPSTMEFAITDLSARLDGGGELNANILAKNFLSPDIELETNTVLDLKYFVNFFNLTDYSNLSGKLKLGLKFHDVIDVKNLAKTLNSSSVNYSASLQAEKINYRGKLLPLALKDLNMKLSLKRKSAELSQLKGIYGKSNFDLKASIDDFPAVVHHTNEKVKVDLNIKSNLIDLSELTLDSTGKKSSFDEKINDLDVNMSFIGSAKDFTESKYLPCGEFDINSFSARLKNYPHNLHDIKLHLNIQKDNLQIVKCKGMVDKSDFDFSADISNYGWMFEDTKTGNLKTGFSIHSTLLEFKDIFTYSSINYMPEEYRHELCRELICSGNASVGLVGKNYSFSCDVNRFETNMKLHPLRIKLQNVKANYTDSHLDIENIQLQMGHTNISGSLKYFTGSDSTIAKKENHITLNSSVLDMDELFSHTSGSENKTSNITNEHEKAFNIYDLPFPDLSVDLNIGQIKFNRYNLKNLKGKIVAKPNHHLKLENIELQAAGGDIKLNGEFDGSNRNKIFIDPDLNLKNLDIDQLLFKFENFGQDHLVSENVHGRLSGKITGHIRVHPDLVPVLDESDVKLDLSLTEGRLENYGPMSVLSSYFKDKNLNRVVFDTLENHFRVNKGVINVPSMTINSSLGFIDVSGKQSMDSNMEYFVKVPLKLVTKVGWQKLFGKTNDNASNQDEIQYKSDNKNTKYLNLKIKGKGTDFKISLGKDKSG